MELDPETVSVWGAVLALQHLMGVALADVARAIPDGNVARLVNDPRVWDVASLAITHPALEDAVSQDVAALLEAANQRLTLPRKV